MTEGKAGFHDNEHTWQSGSSNGKLEPETPAAQPPKCPECTSQKVWKDGLRRTRNGDVQRWLCRSCGYRFSEPNVKVNITSQFGETSHSRKNMGNLRITAPNFPFKKKLNCFSLNNGENITSHDTSSNFTDVAKPLKSLPCYNSKRRVCVSESEAKNLVEVESRIEKQAAGATKLDQSSVKGKIVEFLWHLKKQGKTEGTIKTYTKYVELLSRAGANIFDPESTKLTIATHFTDKNTKRLATYAYDAFLKFIGKTWVKPEYKGEDKQIFIPTDQELQLAVNSGRKGSIAFNILEYETGARYNEAERLEWTDIDVERCKITIKASKNGNARTLTVSRQLTDTLLRLPRLGQTVFPPRARETRRVLFRKRMKKLARLYDNPRFLKIHYHTFRHCKALREYHKTRSILHVKKVLGHKSILTTQRYVDLYTEIYGDLKPEDYVCEAASTVQEAKKLVEAGFEYVCEINGEQLFRKVK